LNRVIDFDDTGLRDRGAAPHPMMTFAGHRLNCRLIPLLANRSSRHAKHRNAPVPALLSIRVDPLAAITA
jgi:hypothetical protein